MLIFYLLFINYVFGYNQTIAASHARYLMSNRNVGVLSSNTLYGSFNKSISYPSLEDYAESPFRKGYPIFLLADISLTAKNLLNYSIGSFVISARNCSKVNYLNMTYDPLACSRFTITGQFVRNPKSLNATDPNISAFILKHPAAFFWLQHVNHGFRLWNFIFYGIYYIGGYGNLHYIGPIDLNVYYDAQPIPPV